MAGAELQRLEHPEWLLLAALILDTAGEDSEPVALARRLVQRLDLGAAAEQEIALLVGDSGLLRAAAGRVEGLDEESVLQLASHLERAERARALYLMSLALGELEAVERARIDELLELVIAMLEQPGVTGLEARNLVEQRRAEAMRLVSDPAAQERIAARAAGLPASPRRRGHVARQVGLLEQASGPWRGAGRAVRHSSPDAWEIDVASTRPAGVARPRLGCTRRLRPRRDERSRGDVGRRRRVGELHASAGPSSLPPQLDRRADRGGEAA